MGNQELKFAYVFDRQRLMNADQKFRRKRERKMEKMIHVFPASVLFSLSSKKPKHDLILRDD